MQAVDFFLYCCGVGVVLISGAGSVRLLMGNARNRPTPTPASPQPEPPPPGADLMQRLQSFQEQRFGSPIVCHPPGLALRRPPTPGEPGGPRVVPSRIRVPQRVRPQPPENGNVVTLPVKMQNDTTNKGE